MNSLNHWLDANLTPPNVLLFSKIHSTLQRIEHWQRTDPHQQYMRDQALSFSNFDQD